MHDVRLRDVGDSVVTCESGLVEVTVDKSRSGRTTKGGRYARLIGGAIVNSEVGIGEVI